MNALLRIALAIAIVFVPRAIAAGPVLTPPAGSIYFGVRTVPSSSCTTGACTVAALAALETRIGRRFALQNSYYGWTGLGMSFPGALETDDVANGRIPVVAWNCSYPNTSIAAGAHDADILAAAAALKAYGHPVFLRYFWEMNLHDSANGRTGCYDPATDLPGGFFSPTQFVAAWQHIHALFAAQGVTNVVWLWCPGGGTAGPPLAAYYPGDAAVDWLGLDVYDAAGGPAANYLAKPYARVVAVSAAKPLMVAETGVPSAYQAAVFGGTATALQTLYPAIKAYLYFDTGGPLGDWTLAGSGESAFAALGRSAYLGASVPVTTPGHVAQLALAAAPAPSHSAVPIIASATVPFTTPAAHAALLCVHFASNPMCKQLPANPAVASQSSAWSALQFGSGRNNLGGMQISNAPDPFLDSWDDSEVRYELPKGATTVEIRLTCDKASWSSYLCGLDDQNGAVLKIPAGVQPQGGSDHHFAYDDFANNGEQDFWLADQPSQSSGSTLHVGGAGFCAWGGDGTDCSGSTATNIATSLGGIDAKLLHAGEADPVHGSLPYALSVAEICNAPSATYVYPATASDGDNSTSAPPCAGHTGPGGEPPEGTRLFLALHDADVNATPNAPYVKVILRTLDEDHFGATVTDTNWDGSGSGLLPQFNRGNYAWAAAEAGIAYGTDVLLPITTNGINLQSTIRYCQNGTC